MIVKQIAFFVLPLNKQSFPDVDSFLSPSFDQSYRGDDFKAAKVQICLCIYGYIIWTKCNFILPTMLWNR